MKKIVKKSTLGEAFNHPNGKKILAKHGVPCVGCPMAAMELEKLTLQDIANRYSLDLKNLLKELNSQK